MSKKKKGSQLSAVVDHVLGESRIYAKKTLKETKKGLEETFGIAVVGKGRKIPRGFVPIEYYRHEGLLNQMVNYRNHLRKAQEDRRDLQKTLRFCKTKNYYTEGYIREVKKRLEKARKMELQIEKHYLKAKASLEEAVAKDAKKG